MEARESPGGKAATPARGLAALAQDVEQLVRDAESTDEMPPLSDDDAAHVLERRATR